MNDVMFTPKGDVARRIIQADELAIEAARRRVQDALDKATELPLTLPASALGTSDLVRNHILTRLKAFGYRVDGPKAPPGTFTDAEPVYVIH